MSCAFSSASFVANTNSVKEMKQEVSRGLKYMDGLFKKEGK